MKIKIRHNYSGEEIICSVKEMDETERLKDNYMKMSLFIQGLIDRTEVFSPIKEGIKITEIEENGGINLIYDAEPSLSDGRLSFADWKNKINENVGRGSRIIIAPNGNDYAFSFRNDGSYWEGYYKYYDNDYSKPNRPSTGLYTVEETEYEITNDDRTKTNIKIPCIKYKPSDKYYSWTDGYVERSNRVTWVVSLKNSWYLNYDRISLDDIDFYLNSRIDRPNYLEILPLLRELKKQLIEEQKKEVHFIEMLKGMAYNKGIKLDENLDNQIKEALDWWKFKNIWKRPITRDDTKACRMIEKRLFKQ